MGSPLANIALAALAQKAKGSAAIAVTDTDVSGNQPNVSDASQGRGDSASPRDKSKLWKQAAEFRRIGNITGGGTNRAVGGRNQGFHVAAALHASHGLTIQKLREALDDQSKVTDQVRELVCLSRSCPTICSITDRTLKSEKFIKMRKKQLGNASERHAS